MSSHTCHAVNCERFVPPRLHMCAPHWRMVPKPLQRALWAAYRPGQERRMDPSAAYLHAAADCVRSVAEGEGQPPEDIEFEVGLYTSWAEMLESPSCRTCGGQGWHVNRYGPDDNVEQVQCDCSFEGWAAP